MKTLEELSQEVDDLIAEIEEDNKAILILELQLEFIDKRIEVLEYDNN